MAKESEEEQEQRALVAHYGAALASTLKLVKKNKPRMFAMISQKRPGADDPFLLLVSNRLKDGQVTAAEKGFKKAFKQQPVTSRGVVRLDEGTLVFETTSTPAFTSAYLKSMREQLKGYSGLNRKVSFESVATLSEADESEDDADDDDADVSPE